MGHDQIQPLVEFGSTTPQPSWQDIGAIGDTFLDAHMAALSPDGRWLYVLEDADDVYYSNDKQINRFTLSGGTIVTSEYGWEDLSPWLHGQTRTGSLSSSDGIDMLCTDSYIWLIVRDQAYSNSSASYTWTVYAKAHEGGTEWANGTDNGYGWYEATGVSIADPGGAPNTLPGPVAGIEDDRFILWRQNDQVDLFDSGVSGGSLTTVGTLPDSSTDGLGGGFGPWEARLTDRAVWAGNNTFWYDFVRTGSTSSASGSSRFWLGRANFDDPDYGSPGETYVEMELYWGFSSDDTFDVFDLYPDTDDPENVCWLYGNSYRYSATPEDSGMWWLRVEHAAGVISVTDAINSELDDGDVAADDSPLWAGYWLTFSPEATSRGDFVHRYAVAEESSGGGAYRLRWWGMDGGWVLNRMTIA